MKRLSAIAIALIINLSTLAQNKEIPFTQEDKDKLERIEIKLKNDSNITKTIYG